MVGRKVFPTKPERKYSVSQCEEHDCSANNNENPSLSQFTDELWL